MITKNFKVYTAGKVWHQDKFKDLRDNKNYNVKARWIDLKDEDDIVQNHKDELWKLCYEQQFQMLLLLTTKIFIGCQLLI